jgi:hypothetical protein
VLQRTAGRPRLRAGDRFILAGLAQRLPPARPQRPALSCVRLAF